MRYRGWPELLPPDVHVAAVELPARGSRFGEPAVHRMEEVVDAVLAEIGSDDRVRDGRLVLWGHSFGATVAHATALALTERARAEPAALFVAGKNAPWWPNGAPLFHRMSDGGLWRALQRFGGTPEAVLAEPELKDVFLPALRADLEIAETYHPRPGRPLGCPVRAFAANGDPLASAEGMHAWSRVNERDFALRRFSGDHFFVHEREQRVVSAIGAELDALLGQPSAM